MKKFSISVFALTLFTAFPFSTHADFYSVPCTPRHLYGRFLLDHRDGLPVMDFARQAWWNRCPRSVQSAALERIRKDRRFARMLLTLSSRPLQCGIGGWWETMTNQCVCHRNYVLEDGICTRQQYGRWTFRGGGRTYPFPYWLRY